MNAGGKLITWSLSYVTVTSNTWSLSRNFRKQSCMYLSRCQKCEVIYYTFVLWQMALLSIVVSAECEANNLTSLAVCLYLVTNHDWRLWRRHTNACQNVLRRLTSWNTVLERCPKTPYILDHILGIKISTWSFPPLPKSRDRNHVLKRELSRQHPMTF